MFTNDIVSFEPPGQAILTDAVILTMPRTIGLILKEAALDCCEHMQKLGFLSSSSGKISNAVFSSKEISSYKKKNKENTQQFHNIT